MSLPEENWRRRAADAEEEKAFERRDRLDDWWSRTDATPPPDTGVDEKGNPVPFRSPNTLGKSDYNRAIEYLGRARMASGPQSEKWQTLGQKSLAQARERLGKEAAKAQGIVVETPAANVVGAESSARPVQAPEQLAGDSQIVLEAGGAVTPQDTTGPSTPPQA